MKRKEWLEEHCREIRHAAAIEAVPVYLECYDDVGQGDREAFIGLVHPDFADTVRAACTPDAEAKPAEPEQRKHKFAVGQRVWVADGSISRHGVRYKAQQAIVQRHYEELCPTGEPLYEVVLGVAWPDLPESSLRACPGYDPKFKPGDAAIGRDGCLYEIKEVSPTLDGLEWHYRLRSIPHGRLDQLVEQYLFTPKEAVAAL